MPEPSAMLSRPLHVAIIMDGNGRWAAQRGLPRLRGHEAGTESVQAVVRACRDRGIRYLTLYAFSVENWKRPREEVGGLMNLLVRFLRDQERELHAHAIRLRLIGRQEDLPEEVRRELDRVTNATRSYEKGHLILALSYGGRTEIATAARRIAEQVKAGHLEPAAVDEALFSRFLYAPDIPDPDLIIRTSGEMRLSNFLLWQSAYAELYVTPVLWPDFREREFEAALDEFSRRQRRFGGLGAEEGSSEAVS